MHIDGSKSTHMSCISHAYCTLGAHTVFVRQITFPKKSQCLGCLCHRFLFLGVLIILIPILISLPVLFHLSGLHDTIMRVKKAFWIYRFVYDLNGTHNVIYVDCSPHIRLSQTYILKLFNNFNICTEEKNTQYIEMIFDSVLFKSHTTISYGWNGTFLLLCYSNLFVNTISHSV